MKTSAYVLAMSTIAAANCMAQTQTQPKPPSQHTSTPAVPTVPPPAAPVPKEFTFPAVTYACISLLIPEDDKAAERAIDEARVRWYQTARGAGLKQASSVFIHAKVPVGDAANNAALPAEACGIVSQVSMVQGMEIRKLPSRQGIAGFCDKVLDVQECLASASKKGGFTEEKPWPWLPMYARWPLDQPNPATEGDVIRHLRTSVSTIPYAPPGSGVPRERSTNGPKPLVECKECDVAEGPKETDAKGRGIGWFIPLK